jgi:nitrous oxide reductase
MADLSRRQFIGKGSIGVAAGVAALTIGSQGAIAEAATRAEKDAPVDPSEATADEPVVAYVKQGAHGEVRVMVGSREVVHKDAELARRIIRASKKS